MTAEDAWRVRVAREVAYGEVDVMAMLREELRRGVQERTEAEFRRFLLGQPGPEPEPVTADRVTWEVPTPPEWARAILGEEITRPEAEVRRALGLPPRDADATLADVDAAVEGRCAGPGCAATLTEHSPSRWWCSPTCQELWQHRHAGRPSPGSAPVRGSEEVDPSAMRWRPDLAPAFDDSDLTLLDRHHRDGTGLNYCVYTRADSDTAFLRVDDGYRFVGLDVAWAELEESGPAEPFRRLERELTDRRRLDPDPLAAHREAMEEHAAALRATLSAFGANVGLAAEAFNRLAGRLAEAYEAQEGERAVLPGEPDPQVGGTVFWMPDPPADPEAPTAAELAGAVDLTPYLAPAGTVFRCPPNPELRAGDRITLHWSAAGDDQTEVTELEVAEVRPDGIVDTVPAERSVNDERFRRVGERVSVPVVAGPFAETFRRAAQEESDRVALRALCTDESMYERALAAAQDRGWSARQMMAAVAAGEYTEQGWTGGTL